MMTTPQMWDKLMDVMDSATTREQSKGAYKYAVLWYRNMHTRMTVADVELWYTLVEDLGARFPPK